MKQKHYGAGHISRLKKRFSEGKVSDSEIIELLISCVIKGRDVKPQVKEIYRKSGSKMKNVPGVIEKEKIKGVGPKVKLLFALIKEYTTLCAREKFTKRKYSVKSQEDVINYFREKCAFMDRENVYAVFLDAKNRVITDRELSGGTLTQALLYPREVIKNALNEGALSIIVIHNHPSGDPAPSENDKKITRKLLYAAREMDIALLDHLVIGRDGKGYYSFYEEGVIDKYIREHSKIHGTI